MHQFNQRWDRVFLGVGLDLIAPLFVFANPIPLGDIPCSMTLTFR